ncbi:laccase-15 [Quercus suber]|uniref:Laccase-15 n=1 Tax=Quercus suber TaxID=58331 RepID=A0AAW0M1W9_QUESU
MVDQGKTYLLRQVNAVVSADMFFAIAQHDLTIVGTDGNFIKPDKQWTFYSQAVQLYNNGQDSDLLSHNVTANQSLGLYYIAAISINKVVFRNITPSTSEEDILASSANNISWSNPISSNVLLAYYRNISGVYTTDFPDFPPSFYNFTGDDYEGDLALTNIGTKVKVLNYNEAVEIVFQGTNLLDGSAFFPMHLHGYSFYVVGKGFGNYDNETDPKSFNLVDPVEVNTFSVPKNGWLAIRFVANNPVTVTIKRNACTLEIPRHMTLGMAAVFIVKNGDTTETSIRKPPPLQSSIKILASEKCWIGSCKR